MKKILLVLLLLSGCGGTITTNTVLQPTVPVVVPDAQPMNVNPTQWQVLTLPQLQALVKNNQSLTLFVLDAKNYTNLQLNFEEVKRYIAEQNAIITMLKKINDDRANENSATQKGNK